MKPIDRPLYLKRIEQSMSRKSCSPDDGLMEGFFGILKREMFYGKDAWDCIYCGVFILNL